MPGRLDLTSPWAREGLTVDERRDVSVSPDRRKWVFWTKAPDGTASHKLHVSHSMALFSACFYALRHWKLLSETTVTLDELGYIKEISDAG